MPVDPQIQALLDKGTGVTGHAYHAGAEARRAYEARIARHGAGRLRWRRSRSDPSTERGGGPIALRIYTRPAPAGPFRSWCFFHGSGFVLCSLDTHDGNVPQPGGAGIGCVGGLGRRLPARPRNTSFPAGLDDCLVATRWAAAHAAELSADPAGSCWPATAQAATWPPSPHCGCATRVGQRSVARCCLYPVTDYHTPGTPSYFGETPTDYGLTRDTMEWFWAHYLNDAAEADHPHASPLRAQDLTTGLPPAYIVSAEYDPLRDEAERLRAEACAPPGCSHQKQPPAGHESRLSFCSGWAWWVALTGRMEEACTWGVGVSSPLNLLTKHLHDGVSRLD